MEARRREGNRQEQKSDWNHLFGMAQRAKKWLKSLLRLGPERRKRKWFKSLSSAWNSDSNHFFRLETQVRAKSDWNHFFRLGTKRRQKSDWNHCQKIQFMRQSNGLLYRRTGLEQCLHNSWRQRQCVQLRRQKWDIGMTHHAKQRAHRHEVKAFLSCELRTQSRWWDEVTTYGDFFIRQTRVQMPKYGSNSRRWTDQEGRPRLTSMRLKLESVRLPVLL